MFEARIRVPFVVLAAGKVSLVVTEVLEMGSVTFTTTSVVLVALVEEEVLVEPVELEVPFVVVFG
jgi:hypothetical protein